MCSGCAGPAHASASARSASVDQPTCRGRPSRCPRDRGDGEDYRAVQLQHPCRLGRARPGGHHVVDDDDPRTRRERAQEGPADCEGPSDVGGPAARPETRLVTHPPALSQQPGDPDRTAPGAQPPRRDDSEEGDDVRPPGSGGSGGRRHRDEEDRTGAGSRSGPRRRRRRPETPRQPPRAPMPAHGSDPAGRGPSRRPRCEERNPRTERRRTPERERPGRAPRPRGRRADGDRRSRAPCRDDRTPHTPRAGRAATGRGARGHRGPRRRGRIRSCHQPAARAAGRGGRVQRAVDGGTTRGGCGRRPTLSPATREPARRSPSTRRRAS